MRGRLLRTWAACGAAVAVLWLPVGCAGGGSASHSPTAVQSATDSSVPRAVVTGPGAAHAAGADRRLPATVTAAPSQPCTAMSGFSLSLAIDAHGAPTPAAAIATFLTGPQYAPGYTAPLNQWHVKTRTAHAVSFSTGAATLSVIDLADKTWVVISGEACTVKIAASSAPSATSSGYLDDGVHVMPPPVRQRAAVQTDMQVCRMHLPTAILAQRTTVAGVTELGPRPPGGWNARLGSFGPSSPVTLCLIPGSSKGFEAIAITPDGKTYPRWPQSDGTMFMFPM